MAQAIQSRGPVTGTAVGSARKKRPFLLDLYSTAVGKKYAMAISGLMLIGFVVVHMVGNLKMYLGEEDFNHYAEFLRELLVPILPRTVLLWLLRFGLLAAAVVHVHAAVSLTRLNREARSVKYQSARDY
ncbi:MAG: succinate dehydrogenase cytochrome b subunit [Actinomycetota bacterium]